MKLTESRGEVLRSDTFPEKKFTIAATAQAFEILSSKLYSDIYAAIVRELSTNAYDAHVEAGHPERPFNVQLPTQFDPVFSIRDFGTGLSPESVERVYTTYFASTRNGSDDFVGALGLGSKSPFAYTDQFTVRSFYNGTLYTYTAYKSSAGEPTVALLTESPTEEENGLEITFNVKEYGDYFAFKAAASEIYLWFKTRPNIKGANITFEEEQPAFSNDQYEVSVGSTSVCVVMGNVKYDVDTSKLQISAGGNIVLYMPIGSCSIAASREELHHDQKTIANVQTALNAAYADITAKIQALINQGTTELEKAAIASRYTTLCKLAERQKIAVVKQDVYACQRYSTRNDKLYQHKDVYHTHISVSDPSVFVEDDLEEWKQSDKNRLRYWMDMNGYGSSTRVYVCAIQDRTEFVRLFGEPIVKMSTLPEAPRTLTVTEAKKTRSFIKQLVYSRRRRNESWINIEDLSLIDSKTHVAVIRDGYDVEFDGQNVNPAYLWQLARDVLGTIQVVGIAKKHYTKIRTQLGLEDLETIIRKKVADEFGKLDSFDLNILIHGPCYVDDKILKTIKGLSKTCDNYYKLAKVKPLANESIKHLIRAWHQPPAVIDYKDEFNTQYPLLAHIDTYYASEKDIREYIQLIEAKNV